MKKASIPMMITLILATLLVNLSAGIGSPKAYAYSQSKKKSDDPPAPTLYLPLVFRNYPLVTIFGADARSQLSKVSEAGLSWARGASVIWSQVESTEGVYDWSAYGGLDSFLVEASQKNIQVILVVQRAPTWARKYDKACGPIRSDKLDSFANFMVEVVRRYSVPPYNLRYFQIWNEQDAPTGVSDTLGIGCWGEQSYPGDPYYGGEYFGELLKRVYPKVKQANAGAQVVTGALLLDCDPREVGLGYCPSSNPSDPYHPSKWNFTEGMIKNGAAFDILAFNGYAYYEQNKSGVWKERTREKWSASGGAVDGKLDYLRSLLSKYGVNKPIMLTEVGIFYENSLYDGPTTPQYEEEKADYLTYVYANTWSHGLQASIWFSLKSLSSKLLDSSNNPLPAYNALKTMTGILAQADYKSREDNAAGYTKFVYHLGNQEIWLLIPTGEIAGTNYSVAKPSNFIKLVDIYGNEMPDPGSTITFNRPTYVFLTR